MYKLTALLISVLLLGFSLTLAQDARSTVQPNIVITGNEVGDPTNNLELFTADPVSFGPVNSGGLVWTVNNIENRQSGYDLQSNGSTQEIWYDLNNPGYLHAVFSYSSVCDNAWADRTCLYFGSDDGGANWFELGAVPVNTGTAGRSGFPSIIGKQDGSAVIANHNNADQTATRTTVFIDDGAFSYSFSNFDPGEAPFGNGQAIWPILGMTANDELILASSVNGGDSFYVNTLAGGVFSGWQTFNGDQAETQSLNVSDGGKVGMAYAGGNGNDYDVWYTESTDAGLTWTTPLRIWDAVPDAAQDYFGCIRGVSVNFYGEEPVVVFECGWNTATGYYPGRESEIRFWSPNINGGNTKAIADTNNVGGFVPNFPGVADVMYPIGRPVIGRSQVHDYLFVAFQTTSGEFWPGAAAADSTAFFQGMFMYSTDGGDTWTDPEVFTPVTTPLLDFRHVSIVPVAPVSPVDDDIITVHLAMQGDPMPASTANGWGIMPPSITAQYYHFTTDILVEIIGVEDDISLNSFALEQNYPNPFNPSTTIKYTLGERSAVTLKVYDVLGNEVANLVNTTQEAGQHSVNFDASSLSSGLYIYTLNTGNFTSSKKMMLLK
ncbi:MAG: T9SS type A sorting domain-containing protein [Ignavibacteriaceae bacterium]|nr:T9SS type A sorting domain-containing protein [Ignavibacteriaceae bacterium]